MIWANIWANRSFGFHWFPFRDGKADFKTFEEPEKRAKVIEIASSVAQAEDRFNGFFSFDKSARSLHWRGLVLVV